jgi:hypothetical protein
MELILPSEFRVSARPGVWGLLLTLCLMSVPVWGESPEQWLQWNGTAGPGKGKSVVLIAGDEEYRSEEALPMLAKILARRHGFSCTVLLAQDDDGTINPDRRDNIPGLHRLATADLMVIFTRFRALPDRQMQEIDHYLRQGKPVIGLRTATHAFALPPKSKYG